jgi:3-ketosteroid 9alpha-monooxygenase subunit B
MGGVTDTIPDEPLGRHVLELEIADVVTETEDARSLVFKVPDGPQDPQISEE